MPRFDQDQKFFTAILGQLNRIESRLAHVESRLEHIVTMEAKMALTLDDIQADEDIEAATLQKLLAAFNDLAAKLNAAGQDPVKLNALHGELVANAAAMQAALDALGPAPAPAPVGAKSSSSSAPSSSSKK